MKILFIVASFFLLGCHSGSKKGHEIDIDRIHETDCLLISEFADSVFFIPLDQSKPLAHITNEALTDSVFYFAEGLYGGLRLYDLKGHFLHQCGRSGRGPGEYLFSRNFCVGEDGKVYIYSGKQLLTYDRNGKWLGTYDLLGTGVGYISDIVCRGDKLYIKEYASEPSTGKYAWLVTDTCGNVISWKKKPYQEVLSSDYSRFYEIKEGVCWWDSYNDTIFLIDDQGHYQVRYLWKKTAQRLPELKRFKLQFDDQMRIINDPYPDAYRFSDLAEIPDGRMISLFWKGIMGEYLYLLYDPFEGSGHYSKYVTDDLCGLVYGDEFYFSVNIHSTSQGIYCVQVLMPLKLKKWIDSKDFKEMEVKTPRFKQQLKELADRLEEEDNWVIVVYRLKE